MLLFVLLNDGAKVQKKKRITKHFLRKNAKNLFSLTSKGVMTIKIAAIRKGITAIFNLYLYINNKVVSLTFHTSRI